MCSGSSLKNDTIGQIFCVRIYSVLSLNIGSSLNAAVLKQATKVMIQINAMSNISMWPFSYAQLFLHG